MTFQLETVADAVDGKFSYLGWQASDGVHLKMTTGDLGTNALANGYFDNELKQAVRIYEHTVRKDRNGDVVGQRAIATFPLGGTQPDDSIIWVLWTQGAKFYEIGSASFSDTLALESPCKQPTTKAPSKRNKRH